MAAAMSEEDATLVGIHPAHNFFGMLPGSSYLHHVSSMNERTQNPLRASGLADAPGA